MTATPATADTVADLLGRLVDAHGSLAFNGGESAYWSVEGLSLSIDPIWDVWEEGGDMEARHLLTLELVPFAGTGASGVLCRVSAATVGRGGGPFDPLAEQVTDRRGQAFLDGLDAEGAGAEGAGAEYVLTLTPGEGEAERQQGLTPRLKRDPRRFMWKMREVAPLMLERLDLPPEQTAAFLRYLGQDDILRHLARAERVSDALGQVLADFCADAGVATVVDPGQHFAAWVIDNIMWQIALHDVARRQVPATRQALHDTASRLQATQRMRQAMPAASIVEAAVASLGIPHLFDEVKQARE